TSNEKLTNSYTQEDKDIKYCVAAQGKYFNDFFSQEKKKADKAKIIPWMYSFNITAPILHLLDTRDSGNEGVSKKAYLDKDAKWHIYFVLGKPSSQHDINKHDSYCYLVRTNDLVGITNSFYLDSSFQNAKSKLDKKLQAAVAEANKNRAVENKKRLEQQFKANPTKTFSSIEKNLKSNLSKIDAKTITSKDFIKEIKLTQLELQNFLKLVKKSHPKFYANNFKRLKDEDWYKQYLKSEK
ncbi:MAG: hypothetical protein KAT06_01780, partial [Gammaproteobacteria bacterium]|nr:hypothetical protein [Gammaproteobacteria bacterium]